ncbi:MacB-like core domain-containing protein [Mucilaginibacter lappiensis]|uniref:ABC-type antimicrobial peptide transport system permease subunit n=1 Tax=Mucilaginibacter lappiensis TaxID=354630 RepID=A0ABR6PII2_9SPHI|nr:ABC transporter permease [Mucilaginibacter lappiensis]MBB6109572.1 ABC-type antimicrobial peptide transport system permease subunit [Mucilaginibacter lappiensis]SIQ90228.1 MacB-like core domain-containing protein [Mucilaginibacter lappiensis]
MLKTYFKLAYRNIIRDKAYSLINITGLAVGLASSILILLWVQNEFSYDKFHKNANQIYRISCNLVDSKTVGTPAGMPAGLKAEMPVVKNTVRIQPSNTTLLETGNKKFQEERVFYADPSFMDVFSYPLVKGDRNTALKQVDGALISQEMATKYFGKEDPIGKVIRKDNKENVIVTGVLANIPPNSDLQFDFILPMTSLARTNNDLKNSVWNNFNFYDYVQLDKNFDPSASNLLRLEKQIDQIFRKHDSMKATFQLQPLTKIHLAPEQQGDLPGHGNAQYVNIFFIVAILILVVACINFMNLATARSARRAKEIGLRKVAGAIRGQLIIQFLSESVFISFLSLLFALGIVILFLPIFNELANRKLAIDISDAKLWISLLGIALLTGLISGSYPALFLSGFNPVKVLKGNVKSMGGNLLFRNTLVVIQFMVSIVLLVGTVVIYNQLKFIRDRNPGFDKANLLYVPMTGDIWKKQQAFKNELKQNPLTSDFAVITDLPTNLGGWTVSVDWDGKDPRSQLSFPVMGVDEDFTHTFRMKLAAGRSFSRAFKADSNNYMVNEKMLSVMGLNASTAIGKSLTLWGNKGTIIGVVKDFNFKPVQQAIEPLVMPFNKIGGYVMIRTLPGKTNATVQALSSISQELNPAYPFKFDFLDQDLSNLYKGEQQMGNIFNLFAALGIFISCLGLYGLSAFMAEQRTKEIGVRKVLGASVFNLVYLLSASITRLIFIAIFIAIPLSWYAVNSWLAGFAYHIHVGWLVFFIASLAALSIAWLTVSYESIKAAIVNPIKSLRTE